MIRLDPHCIAQANAKGFPLEVVAAVANHPNPISREESHGLERYRCRVCGGPQVRIRAKVDGYDLVVAVNECHDIAVTVFYGDRPTAIRPDQIRNGVTSYLWKDTDPRYRGLRHLITETDDDAVWETIQRNRAAEDARRARRNGQTQRPAQQRHNPAPKHTGAYYKKKKKQAKKKNDGNA